MWRAIKIFLFAVIFFISISLLAQSYDSVIFSGVQNLISGPYFVEKISPEDLKKAIDSRKIRVLIVPGHDDNNPGAVFGEVREVNLNLDLGLELFRYLRDDPKFEPFITRKEGGDYNEWFRNYINIFAEDVVSFRNKVKTIFSSALKSGNISSLSGIFHNPAADNTSINLYAVNKVANDYNIDIVLHVHFNDYPRKNKKMAGKYSGFAIYVPESQLPNARVSQAVGEFLKNRLAFYNAGSNLKSESSVVVEDQELIAVGSNASREGASILIEYGYIYEPQFQSEEILTPISKELAFQTYLGLTDYFLSKEKRRPEGETTILFNGKEGFLSKNKEAKKNVLALQGFLRRNNFYPPDNKNLNDCPISGIYGPCTSRAVELLEISMGFKNPDGLWDAETGKKALSSGLLSKAF